jgi:AcrR family transcriptional regulator
MESDLTQQRLLEAAGQIFAEKGFRAATIREICQKAGANVAAVNYYFRDKERLYDAVLHNAFQCRMDQLPLPVWLPGTPPEQKLREFLRTVLTRMLEVHSLPWQMQLLVRELSQPSEVGTGLVRDFIRPIYEQLWAILREILPADVSEEQLHMVGFSIIGQCFYFRVGRQVIGLVVGEDESKVYDTERLADHIACFSLAALAALARPGAARPKETKERAQGRTRP